jgi:hypothetical protein
MVGDGGGVIDAEERCGEAEACRFLVSMIILTQSQQMQKERFCVVRKDLTHSYIGLEYVNVV